MRGYFETASKVYFPLAEGDYFDYQVSKSFWREERLAFACLPRDATKAEKRPAGGRNTGGRRPRCDARQVNVDRRNMCLWPVPRKLPPYTRART